MPGQGTTRLTPGPESLDSGHDRHQAPGTGGATSPGPLTATAKASTGLQLKSRLQLAQNVQVGAPPVLICIEPTSAPKGGYVCARQGASGHVP
jgi:hypothetical protein